MNLRAWLEDANLPRNREERFEVYKKYNVELIFLIVTVAFFLFLILVSGKTYIGGVSYRTAAYKYNGSGEPYVAAYISRGSVVRKTAFTRKDGDRTLQLVDYGENEYYVDKQALVSLRRNLVREKDVYVRTPLTVYENEDGPEIATAMSKGSMLHVLGYDELMDSGFVHKYKVEYTDSLGNSGEGYIYGKYVVGTEEESLENYNEHGEYDNAKKAKLSYNLYGGKAVNLDYFPYEKTPIGGKEIPQDARTMYINTWAAVNPDKYVELINKTDCNAVCIDIKDGQMTYKSEICREVCPTAYKEAYASEEEFRKGVDAYKATGAWTIGRIVVFNDSRYAKDHPEDCIKSPGYKKWPSAYSRNVWEYNIRIAQEAVRKFGFDEIQFDYVRFPESSYSMSQNKKTKFRNTYKEDKCQAIQGFCFYAADQLREVGAYISIDVFGESSYGYVTSYGQYWPAMSNIVDVLSGMPYTDHMGVEGAWNHPYGTVHNWAATAVRESAKISNPALVRTWITGYDTPYWNPVNDYGETALKDQRNALKNAGLVGGFIPWNVGSDLGKYYEYAGVWNEPKK